MSVNKKVTANTITAAGATTEKPNTSKTAILDAIIWLREVNKTYKAISASGLLNCLAYADPSKEKEIIIAARRNNINFFATIAALGLDVKSLKSGFKFLFIAT
jgi:hypothetical protein